MPNLLKVTITNYVLLALMLILSEVNYDKNNSYIAPIYDFAAAYTAYVSGLVSLLVCVLMLIYKYKLKYQIINAIYLIIYMAFMAFVFLMVIRGV